jgi:hypothetical protein
MDIWEGYRRSLGEIKANIGILKKASVSGLIMGLWGIIIFLTLLPPVNMSILDLLSTLGYPRTNPGMFLFYAMNYAFIVAITAPISIYFSVYSYKLGSSLRVVSLKEVGLTLILLTGGSIASFAFVYQNALDVIASYEAAVAQGILPDYAFVPLGLPAIQYAISVSVIIFAVVLMLGAAEMKMKTGLNGFILSWTLALIGALLAVGGWFVALAILTVSVAMIAFSLELRRIALKESK